jgi:hypothetical protein
VPAAGDLRCREVADHRAAHAPMQPNIDIMSTTAITGADTWSKYAK